MVAFICLFVPAFISEFIYEVAYEKRNQGNLARIRVYLFLLLCINSVMFAIVNIKYPGNIYMMIEGYSTFAIKYMIGASLLGVVIPFAAKKTGVRSDERIVFKFGGDRLIGWFAYIYAVPLVFINIIRIFDNNFWGDEAFSIRLAKMSVSQMLKATASDVHPPLYYLLLIAFTRIFGQHGWVYHMVSVIPYIALVIFTLFVIKKKFGNTVAILFLTYISLSQPAVEFNVEARMYSLACTLVFLSFYGLLLILEGDKRGYLLFVIASLGASYSHYYALFIVAFFYIALLVQAINGKEKFTRLAVIYLVTIAGYLPWLFFMLPLFIKEADNYWKTDYPKVMECMKYFYQSDKDWYSYGMLIITIVSVIIIACKRIGLLKIKTENNRIVISAFCDMKELSSESIWSIWGLIGSIGIIYIGEFISFFIKPAFMQRYMYPVFAVFWMVLCVNIMRLRTGKVLAIIIFIVTLKIYIPLYQAAYINDRENDKRCESTEAQMHELINEEDVILSNSRHLNWTILDYYMPDFNHISAEIGYSKFDPNTKYWLVWTRDMTEDDISWLSSFNYRAEEKISDAYLGSNSFYLYGLKHHIITNQNDYYRVYASLVS